MFKKRLLFLICAISFVFSGCTVNNNSSSEYVYLEERTLNDMDVYIYDVKGNDSGVTQVGDVIISFQIVDPSYYGKQSSNILKQVQDMASQIDIDYSSKGMYTKVGEQGVGNATLYYSTEYVNVHDRDWVFLMSNYDEDGVHNNALMGMTLFGDKWIVMDVISAFTDSSENFDIDKQLYKDIIEAYNLTNCLAIDEIMNTVER